MYWRRDVTRSDRRAGTSPAHTVPRIMRNSICPQPGRGGPWGLPRAGTSPAPTAPRIMRNSICPQPGRGGPRGRLRAGTSPAPTPPAKPLYGASAAPPCGAPEAKKKMPSFLVQLENRHRSVKQTCRWHVCSVGRSGYGARRELCGCLLFVQFKHRHECLGRNLYRSQAPHLLFARPAKAMPFAGTPSPFHMLGRSESALRQGFRSRRNPCTAQAPPHLVGPQRPKRRCRHSSSNLRTATAALSKRAGGTFVA